MADAKADADKLEKLKEKYNQMKQANAVLKKGLIDKQEESTRLEQQLKEKETNIRQQMEEIDGLQFQNSRMSKQIGTLSTQVEDLAKNKQQGGWSVGGLMGAGQKAEVQKLENDVAVLRDELMMKIQENEELHMRIFEAQKQHDDERDSWREAESAHGTDLEKSRKELESERLDVERLSGERGNLVQKVNSLGEQLSASETLAQTLRTSTDQERHDTAKTTLRLRTKLSRCLPFDDTQFETWNAYSIGLRQGQAELRREKLLQEFFAAVQETCQQSSGALQMWSSALSHGGGDGESASRLRIRNKLCETSQALAQLIGSEIPELTQMCTGSGLPLSPDQERLFRSRSSELLSIHRRWAAYQSMLLLHEWQSSYAGRSAQEEALAHSFVDCLWRLHRCVRSLFSRLRLVLFLPVVHVQSSSSSHFALARQALDRKGDCAIGKASDLDGASGNDGHRAASAIPQLLQSLGDVSQCWRALGRCLSSWAAAQGRGTGSPTDAGSSGSATAAAPAASASAQEGGGTVVGLLGCVHAFCTAVADQLLPSLEKLAAQKEGLRPDRALLFQSCQPLRRMATAGSAKERRIGTAYMQNARHKLGEAPGSISFEESVRTLQLARRLAAARSQLLAELKQQAQRLQAVTGEKSQLSQELSSLQDSHALLQSNIEAQKAGISAEQPPLQVPLAGDQQPVSSSGELVMSSRQRALLGSLAVTAQESSGMMQHGFFVDVVSLSGAEATLAAGPPRAEALDSWEVAVRKVYEQHVCNLQKQVLAADGKAWEMNLQTQDYMMQIQRQDEEKHDLKDQVANKQHEARALKEDMDATRKNYDSQLGVLTENIIALTSRLSEKDAGLAKLEAHKVLCGHCGTWNAMGKLLGSLPGSGSCQTCKEKILSNS